MGLVASGVFPVFENDLKIGTAGRTGSASDLKSIADMENLTPSFDNGIEEWTPMDTEGWIRRLQTAKSVTFSITGKRHIGDDGNDYVASKTWTTGSANNTIVEWTMPDGTVISMPCIINVTNNSGGDSTNVGALEFELLSDGKPTVTPASPSL